MEEQIIVADDWTRNWQASIAVKITAFVMWVIIPVIFIVSILMLRGTEDELREDFEANADRIAYLVSQELHEARDLDGPRLHTILMSYGFSSLMLETPDGSLHIGEPQPDAVHLERRVALPGGDHPQARIAVFHPPLADIVSTQRNRLIAAMFVAALLFGIFLTWVTRTIVHRPLQVLVNATRAVSAGNTQVRLDVSREDEFGYLSRFFNEMLDQLMEQQRELQSALVQANAASKAKSAFLANMSHELRTPLNAIIGYSEMLQDEIADSPQQHHLPDLQRIHTAGHHLLTLINDILDLSKIEAGKMELQIESFDVRSLLDDVAATIAPLAEERHNTLQVLTVPNVGSMSADMTKLRQTLYNLLSNACKFTDHGRITLKAARHTQDHDDWIVISVTDTGIGIAEEQMDKLFHEFSQADSSHTRKYGGTGLGLAISRRYCQMMGGDIHVVSTVGKGATFTLRLPARGDLRNQPDPAAIRFQAPEPCDEDFEERRQRLCTVLAIDDDPATRDALSHYLSRDGFVVETADTGREGLEMARRLRPDVITLDILLPDIDGWVVLREIKHDDALKDIPVLLVTMTDDVGMGFALGAAGLLTKPIDRHLLADMIRKRVRSPEPEPPALAATP